MGGRRTAGERAPGHGVAEGYLSTDEILRLVREGLAGLPLDGRRVLVLIPDGTPHAIVNHGPGEVRFLNVHSPGGFDRRIGLR